MRAAFVVTAVVFFTLGAFAQCIYEDWNAESQISSWQNDPMDCIAEEECWYYDRLISPHLELTRI